VSKLVKTAWGTLAVAVAVLGLKFGAYGVTGSVALYSDALESTINVVGAIAALIALWVSEQPADANHPYGHQKAEYLSAVVEGGLVLATAFVIAHAAWQAWQAPHPPETPLFGVMLNGSGGLINLVWALFLLRMGRRWRSPALVAGGTHVLTDVWTTGAVLVGFALVWLTGRLWLDPLVAGLVALNILWSGYGMVRKSVGGLMDEVTDPERVAELRRVIAASAEGAIEAHDVRTRTVGSATFVDFHLVVPRRMAVEDAHAICDRIEAALREQVGATSISIHVEPEGKAKHHGVVVL
jgi:cation diffusion facilitator family transporter